MNDEQIDAYFSEVKRMTELQLLNARAGWTPQAAAWHVVDRELQRRDARGTNFRSWVAIVISLIAIVVSLTRSGVSGS